MSAKLEPFRLEALEELAQIIGDHYTGSEITALFKRSGYPEVAHDGGTKWRFVHATFERLQEQGGGTPNHVLTVLQTAGNPQGWIGKREPFEKFLGAVNEVLAFYGLRVREDGTMARTGDRATTVRQNQNPDQVAFDARTFHAVVVKHARSHFSRGAYFHAVFECCKAFDTAVSLNSGNPKSGQPLMSEAMNLKGPVKFNSQQKQSEQDEQTGIMFLCMGLMNAVRNPQAHEPELNWPMSRQDALDVLALLSFLFRKLESAMVVQTESATPMNLHL